MLTCVIGKGLGVQHLHELGSCPAGHVRAPWASCLSAAAVWVFVVNGNFPVSQELAPPGQAGFPCPRALHMATVPQCLYTQQHQDQREWGASSSVLQRLLLFLRFSLLPPPTPRPQLCPLGRDKYFRCCSCTPGWNQVRASPGRAGVTGSPGLPQALPLSATE